MKRQKHSLSGDSATTLAASLATTVNSSYRNQVPT